MSFVWGCLADRLGPRRTLIIVLVSWAVGSCSARSRCRSTAPMRPGAPVAGRLGCRAVPRRGRDPRLGPRRRRRSRTACSWSASRRRHRVGEFFGIYGLVGKASQVIGQVLYGAIVFLLFDSMGIGAYQVAILALIVTMLIGLWLVWPVRDTWAGSGEVHVHGSEDAAPASVPAPSRRARPSIRRQPPGPFVLVGGRLNGSVARRDMRRRTHLFRVRAPGRNG